MLEITALGNSCVCVCVCVCALAGYRSLLRVAHPCGNILFHLRLLAMISCWTLYVRDNSSRKLTCVHVCTCRLPKPLVCGPSMWEYPIPSSTPCHDQLLEVTC